MEDTEQVKEILDRMAEMQLSGGAKKKRALPKRRKAKKMRGGCGMCGMCPLEQAGGYLADDGFIEDDYVAAMAGGSTAGMRCKKFKKVPSVYGKKVLRCADFVPRRGGYLADDGFIEDDYAMGGSTAGMKCKKFKKVPSVYGHKVQRCADFVPVRRPRGAGIRGKRAAARSPWLKFVKEFEAEHPQYYSNRPLLLKKASQAYRRLQLA